ncbi:MAG: putative glycoside hydrolase [Pseudoflavonifractor sp.]
MRNTYGYGSYRGKSRFRSFLNILALVLLVILLLLVGAFLFLQRYAVFSADGMRLELPFFQRQAEPSPSQPLLVIEPSLPPVVLPTPSPTPAPPVLGLHAVPSTVESLSAADLASAGADAAIFDMKRPDGTLGYVSDLQQAKEFQTSAADPALNAALREMNAGEVYTIARVSCFLDNTAPYKSNKLALRTPAGNWRDLQNSRWMSPGSPEAQTYLAGICGELAALGFDEILLDYAGYPTQGNLDYIVKGEAYDAAQFTASLETFYKLVREALTPYPNVKLSIVATAEAVADGSDPLSGQTAALLAKAADRVWLPAPGPDSPDYAAALAAAGMENSARSIMVRTTEPDPKSPGSWSLPQ